MLPHLGLAAERRDEFDDAHVTSALPFHRRQPLVVGVDPLRHQFVDQAHSATPTGCSP